MVTGSMRRYPHLAPLLATTLLPCLALAQVRIEAVTSKQRESQYALDAEQNPLGATSAGKRAAAFLYVEDDHTSHVLVCRPLLRQFLTNHGRYANELNTQLLISAAAYLYEHPQSVADSPRQMLAGLRATLVIYEKFLAADPGTRNPAIDHMLELRKAGKLEEALPPVCWHTSPATP